uniref:Uncharacterized protein n=1 Tax=Grammatophora oceanica TaxID=210454 RepID=A0A7S1Y4J9_9STRA
MASSIRDKLGIVYLKGDKYDEMTDSVHARVLDAFSAKRRPYNDLLKRNHNQKLGQRRMEKGESLGRGYTTRHTKSTPHSRYHIQDFEPQDTNDRVAVSLEMGDSAALRSALEASSLNPQQKATIRSLPSNTKFRVCYETKPGATVADLSGSEGPPTAPPSPPDSPGDGDAASFTFHKVDDDRFEDDMSSLGGPGTSEASLTITSPMPSGTGDDSSASDNLVDVQVDGPYVVRESEEPLIGRQIGGSTGPNSGPKKVAAEEEGATNVRQNTSAMNATDNVEPVVEEVLGDARQSGEKVTELNENTDTEVDLEDAREGAFDLSEMPSACPQCKGSLHTMAQEENPNFYKEKYYKTKAFDVPTRCCLLGCTSPPYKDHKGRGFLVHVCDTAAKRNGACVFSICKSCKLGLKPAAAASSTVDGAVRSSARKRKRTQK